MIFRVLILKLIGVFSFTFLFFTKKLGNRNQNIILGKKNKQEAEIEKGYNKNIKQNIIMGKKNKQKIKIVK